MTENQKIWVELVNYDGSLYAKAKIPDNYRQGVQKVLDSSRGYALRLTRDDGMTVWIGLGFHDRNDAFDFNECFIDFEKQRDRERNPQSYAVGNVDMSAFKLRPGQKLKIGGAGGGNNAGLWDDPFGNEQGNDNGG